MNASRGIKRKPGPAKPLQAKPQPLPEQILPGKLHHSLQEFKRLAKQAKVNETRIIVRKLKSLRSSSDKPGTAKHVPADLEAQLDALKVLNLAHFATAALIQKLGHNRTLSDNKIVSEFISTQLQSSLPLTYYSVQPNSAEGKIRNRLTSCKSFSGRALEIVTDLQAITDPSVARPSSLIPRHATAVDEEEELSEGGEGEDDFFDQSEFSDDKVDDDADGWESGSVHSEDDGLPVGLPTTAINSDPDAESEPGSGTDDDESASDSGSDIPLPSPRKIPKPSGGAGTSTFLPSLSVGYIPGTGDSDPEDELEAIEGTSERKNRRGQRARRAIWEKKYGKGAKHVLKQREEEAEKKRVKEEKRRQREAAAKRPQWATKKVFEPPRQTDSGYKGRIAAKHGGGGGGERVDGQPPLKKPRREDKALHPSWEAKKRMKEKESAAIIPPAGKKIVF